jgi:hypothetical protein
MAKTETSAPPASGIEYPGQALDAAITAARMSSPTLTGRDGAIHAFIPEGFALTALPDSRNLSPWPKSRVIVDDRQSLIAYANRYATQASVIVADFDKGEITARLDWHHGNSVAIATGPDAHSVTLRLRLSEEFDRWNKMAGKLHDQADFARFLEENAVDVMHPDTATMIELSRDFEATVGQTYKSALRLDNGDRRLVFTSETNVQNGIVVPQTFTLHIPVYNGETPDDLTCLFRWRAAGERGVVLGFEWHRLEYQRRAHFQQIAFAAAEDTGLPVYMGRIV